MTDPALVPPPEPQFPPDCDAFEFKRTDTIDLADFAAFQRVFDPIP